MSNLAFDEIIEFSFAGAMVCVLLTVVALPFVTLFFSNRGCSGFDGVWKDEGAGSLLK